MRLVNIVSAAGVLAAAAVPALADEMMGSMMMMKSGEVIAVMPDGHMGTMTMTDPAMADNMMKMSTPLDHCVMLLTGADGKRFMVDTSSDRAKAECEKMAM